MKPLSPEETAALTPVLAAADPLLRAAMERRWNECVVTIVQYDGSPAASWLELKSEVLQGYEEDLEEDADDEVARNLVECLRRPQDPDRIWAIIITSYDDDEDGDERRQVSVAECTLDGMGRILQ